MHVNNLMTAFNEWEIEEPRTRKKASDTASMAEGQVRVVPLAEASEEVLYAMSAACFSEWHAIYRVDYRMASPHEVILKGCERSGGE